MRTGERIIGPLQAIGSASLLLIMLAASFGELHP